MTKLLWDQVGFRRFETGIDHGVLYLPNGTAVAWNGFTSIEESAAEGTEALYFDGNKYMDLPTVEDYQAKLNAITYPDEFLQFEGIKALANGFYVDNQPVDRFNLSYQTRLGNDTNGVDNGYRIHIVYGLTAIPEDTERSTWTDSGALTDFGWTLNGVPQPLTNYKPTSHAFFDSTRVNRFFLKDIEAMLYGTDTTAPQLPSLQSMIDYANNYAVIVVTDNGDGTWTATGPDELISVYQDETFEIREIDAITSGDDVVFSTTYL